MNGYGRERQVGWLLALVLVGGPCVGSEPAKEASQSQDQGHKSAPGAPRSRDADVVVRSKAAADRLRPSSTAGRYDPNPTDWSQVPPWRQTSFFGVRAE